MQDEQREENPDDRVRADRSREFDEILEEEKQRRGIAQKAKRNAAARMNESPCGNRSS
jgi:hypothetical protein